MNAPITRESDDVPLTTPTVAMSWAHAAFYFAIGAAAVAAVLFVAVQVWPLIAGALS